MNDGCVDIGLEIDVILKAANYLPLDFSHMMVFDFGQSLLEYREQLHELSAV